MAPKKAWGGQTHRLSSRGCSEQNQMFCVSDADSVHLEPIMAARRAWQLQQCSLGYRTPSDADSDESVCSVPCGLHQIHPTGKQV